MHEDVPLIVCGAPGGGRGSYDRVAPACRGPVARSSTSLCATLTYVTCYVSVVCLRIGTHFVRGSWVQGCGYGVGRVSVYVVRPPYWRDARAGRGRGRGRRTRDRPADRRRRDGLPAAPSSALAARAPSASPLHRVTQRVQPPTLSATSQTIDCATHMYICDKYSYTVIAI